MGRCDNIFSTVPEGLSRPEVSLLATAFELLVLLDSLFEVSEDAALSAGDQLVIRFNIIVLIHILELPEGVDKRQLGLLVEPELDSVFEHLLVVHLLK